MIKQTLITTIVFAGLISLVWVKVANHQLERRISDLQVTQQVLQHQQEVVEADNIHLQNVEPVIKGKAKVTAYSCYGLPTPEAKRLNCPVGRTKSGTIPVAGKTIACHDSLLGHEVWIDGIGHRICEDTGGAITWDRFDVYLASYQEAVAFGVKERDYAYTVHLPGNQ